MSEAIGTFNPNKFEIQWRQADDRSKSDLINSAYDLPLDHAAVIALQALHCHIPTIQSCARDLLTDVFKRLGKESPNAAMKASSLISSRIYHVIVSNQKSKHLAYLFTALTAFDEHGSFFAFKLLVRGTLDPEDMLSMMCSLPEMQRLGVVDEYFRAAPSVRLRYASLFKAVLKSITRRETMTFYYARLFDRQGSADPFLFANIDPALRDPDRLLEKDIQSTSPNEVICGLKALAMISDEVPSQVLVDLLEGQDVKNIRLTVYRLIENGPLGQYRRLGELLWETLCRFQRRDMDEAVCVFRAIAVGCGLPLFPLMDKVKTVCPELLPGICDEIKGLSRLSFLFIQDIAVNRDKYVNAHPMVLRTLILHMVQKRPERIIRLLLNELKEKKTSSPFVEHLNRLLRKETADIKAQFDLKEAFPKNVRYTRLSTEEKRHFLALRNKTEPTDNFLNLQNRVMENFDLGKGHFIAATLYFNEVVVKGGNWSGIIMADAWFKGSIFYKVDLRNARFENVCFDNVLFRNINAKGAVFVNCSFRNARLFNCNFSHGDLSGVLFNGATISRTQFKETNLSFASFSNCNLSAVSFTEAFLEYSDFSYVRAVFARFSGAADSHVKVNGIDYNARKHQLFINDIPQFPPRVLAEINLMLFCEFTRFGLAQFQSQNKLTLLAAFDVFKPVRADLFQLVPLLIHMNIELKGSNPIDPKTPCGISDFHPSTQALSVLKKYSKHQEIEVMRYETPAIEALYTMGSIGSLAQTPDSDIDYWVCINGADFSPERLDLLEQKMRMLEILAEDLFETSVTFFIVDILKVKRNDFGGTSQESSGSAQAWLLKEEFYRTMIHIAGKLPLWAVVPEGVGHNFYDLIYKRMSRFTASKRYIDLGDVHSVPINEYYGAAIWQMFKWLKSPFKSLIKLAMFEIYAKSLGKEPLLCNTYKNEWMNAGIQIRFTRNDSYIAILDKLLGHYQAAGDRDAMDIFLTCFFLKLEILNQIELDDTVFGLRKVLLKSLLDRWGWSLPQVLKLGQYRSWPYEEIRELSASIEAYMFTKYDQVQSVFKGPCRGNRMISDTDRVHLTRKVDVVYKEKRYKIKKLFLIAENDTYFSDLNLRYHVNGEQAVKWELFQKSQYKDRALETRVLRSDRVEHICAWLIYNHLNHSDAELGVAPNASNIGYNDVKKLYGAMNDFFSLGLGPESVFVDFTENAPTIYSAFVTINFDAEQPQSRVEDYCVIYINTWGEMFCRPSVEGGTFDNLALAKKDILAALDIQTFPVNTEFYFPRGKIA